jgi:MATE family multidrug resistance protein
MGRKDAQAVRYSCYVGYVLSFSAMLIVAVLYIFFPDVLLRIDMDIYSPDNQDLLVESTKLMFLLGIYQIFDGVRVIQAGALRGLKDTRYPMYASVVSFWVIALPCAYLFGFIFNMEAAGVWWGMTLGVFSGVVILFLRLSKSLTRLGMTTAPITATISR